MNFRNEMFKYQEIQAIANKIGEGNNETSEFASLPDGKGRFNTTIKNNNNRINYFQTNFIEDGRISQVVEHRNR